MKVLLDMNLTPLWVQYLSNHEIESVHWAKIGSPTASDREIFEFAASNDYIIFTNDLDFGAILASTKANFPSVIQVRSQDLMPNFLGEKLLLLLKQFEKQLIDGAFITFDEQKLRVRILPF